MARTHLWFGPNGTRKTRAAIQSALEGEKVALFELEPNGFRRAAGADLAKFEASPDFRLHSYRVPATALEQLGELHLMKTKEGEVLAPGSLITYKLEGWLAILAQMQSEYMADCKDGFRPVIDTGTRLWLIERNAWEEQLQAMTQAQIDKVGQAKFSTANYRYLSMLEYADQFNLDTVVIAHEDTVYQSNPPIPKPDAQKETENLVDVVLRFRLTGDGAVANVWKGSEAGVLKGFDIPNPTLGRVNKLIDCWLAIKGAGLPMPTEYDQIVGTGEALLHS